MAPQSQSRLRDIVDGNKLDLSMSGLTDVPVKDIAATKKATILDLSNNQLTVLSPSFCSLTHLIELDLSKNMLCELPESFGSLVSLKRLDLYGNQLSHLPLSFWKLKSLRWLDLKNNPLVPTLAEIAGPCGDNQQCQQCARNVVATLTKTAIKVEEERKKLLEEKLREQELIEQDYLLRKKEIDAENQKKGKKKLKKSKGNKQVGAEMNKTPLSHNNTVVESLSKASEENQKRSMNKKVDTSQVVKIAVFIFCAMLATILGCILCAAYDAKWFLQKTEPLPFVSRDFTYFILQCAKYVENAANYPSMKEMRSQLTIFFRSILSSVLNIYKTICQEFPVYYDALRNKIN